MIETWSGALPNLESIDIDEIILQTLRYLPLDKVGGCFFDREYLAYAILKPNLYCVLLLESMGQMSHRTNLITLTDFVKNESNKLKAETADYINYSEFSRALSGEFPSVRKELFLIEEKEGNKPYQIKTQYPDLLFAMLHSWRNMPFLDKGRASNTFECNTKFYR